MVRPYRRTLFLRGLIGLLGGQPAEAALLIARRPSRLGHDDAALSHFDPVEVAWILLAASVLGQADLVQAMREQAAQTSHLSLQRVEWLLSEGADDPFGQHPGLHARGDDILSIHRLGQESFKSWCELVDVSAWRMAAPICCRPSSATSQRRHCFRQGKDIMESRSGSVHFPAGRKWTTTSTSPEQPNRVAIITVTHNAVSSGMEAASNIGLSKAEGDFLIIHDDYDTSHREFLRATTGYLSDKAHVRIIAVAARPILVHERIEGDLVIEVKREVWDAWVPMMDMAHLISRNAIPPICILIRDGGGKGDRRLQRIDASAWRLGL